MNISEYESLCERMNTYRKLTEVIKECNEAIKQIKQYEPIVQFYVGTVEQSRVHRIYGLDETDCLQLKEFVLEMLNNKIETINKEIEKM